MARLSIIHHVYSYVLAWIVLGACEQNIESMNGSATIFFNDHEELYIYALNYTMFNDFYNCLSSNKTRSCIVSYRNETNLQKANAIEQKQSAQEVTQAAKQIYGCANNMSVNKFTCKRISEDSCSFKRFNTSTYFRHGSNDNNICISLFFQYSYESLSFSRMPDFELCSKNQSEPPMKSLNSLQVPCVPPTTPSSTIAQQPNVGGQSTAPTLNITRQLSSEGDNDPLPIILGVTGAVLVITVVAIVLFIWRRKRLKAKSAHSGVRTETSLEERGINSLNCYSDNTGTPPSNEMRTYNNDNIFKNPDAIDIGKETECSGSLMSDASEKLTASTPNNKFTFSSTHNDTDKTQEKENVKVSYGYEVYDPVKSPARKGDTRVRHSRDMLQKHADITDMDKEEKRKSVHDSPAGGHRHVAKLLSPNVMLSNQTHDYANINLAHAPVEPTNNDASAGQVINKEPTRSDQARAGTNPVYHKFGQDRIKSLNPYNSLKDGVNDQDQSQAEAVQLTHNLKHISNEADKANNVRIIELNLPKDPISFANDYAVLSGEFHTEEQDTSAGYVGSGDQRTSNISAKSYSDYDLIAHEMNVERLGDPVDLSRVSTGVKANVNVANNFDVTEASQDKLSYDYASVQKKTNITVGGDTPSNKSVERETVRPEKYLGETERVRDFKNSVDDYDNAQS